MSWQHHYRGGHRIHGPHRARLWRDGTGMAGVKSTAPGNDVAGSMSFPLPLESQSLVPLPGSPPYDAPRAATWAVDYGFRAGQFEIHGPCCPGQGYFSPFWRHGVAPPFCVGHSCGNPTMSPSPGSQGGKPWASSLIPHLDCTVTWCRGFLEHIEEQKELKWL